MTTPAEEERAALQQHRHRQRMLREAARAREAAARRKRREEQRAARAELEAAQREATRLGREYERAVKAANRNPTRPFPDDRDRDMDRAYAQIVAASGRVQRLAAQLRVVSWDG